MAAWFLIRGFNRVPDIIRNLATTKIQIISQILVIIKNINISRMHSINKILDIIKISIIN